VMALRSIHCPSGARLTLPGSGRAGGVRPLPRALQPLGSSAGAEQWRGGRAAAPRRAGPGPGRSRAYEGALLSAGAEQRNGGLAAASQRNPRRTSPLRTGAPGLWVLWPMLCLVCAKQGTGGHAAAPSRECHAGGRPGLYVARLVPSSGREGVQMLPAGRGPAAPPPPPRGGGGGRRRLGLYAARLVPSCGGDSGEGVTPLPPVKPGGTSGVPARQSPPGIGALRVWRFGPHSAQRGS